MKKLILIAILFASCNPSKNIKEIDGETKLPNSVVIALNDTTGFDKKLLVMWSLTMMEIILQEM